MKTRSHKIVTRPRTHGFVLVVVLCILALLVVLCVAIISSAGTERAAASGFHAAVSTRQLADMTVALVQGQINAATSQGAGVAWVSQPGMARTFDATGALVNAYKLYSAPDLITGKVDFTGGDFVDKPPADWGANTAEWVDLNAPVELDGVKSFPILDPPGASLPEGFKIETAPGSTAYQTAPMPVRWLYVLGDGSIVAPTSPNAKTVTVPGASKAKPIVGRIAFWTDDETCKVNINTASEGTYWDTPHAATTQEMKLASRQPAQREWQRYPGHPAMTSLSSVLTALNSDQIYNIVPRVVGGGSNAGNSVPSGPLTADTDRLYSSVDELIFDPSRATNQGLTKPQLEQAKFFLTTQSRAPETNLFNLPRVACWPVYKLGSTGMPNTAKTTAFDRLIAFCGSTGDIGQNSYHPYLFQRELYSSMTNDIAIARNIQLIQYLRKLMGTNVPGFGGNFAAKYGPDCDQLLMEIFDYVRCLDLADASLTVANQYSSSGTVLPSKYTPGATTFQGFGRTWTVSELAVGFICNAQADNPATPAVDESAGSNTSANLVLGGTPLAPGERYVQAIIVPELFAPLQGWIPMNPSICLRVKGLNGLQVEGQSIFGSLDNEVATIPYNAGLYFSALGGPSGFRTFGAKQASPKRGNLPADAVPTGTNVYPFISLPVKISVSGTTMSFTGGTLTLEAYPSNGTITDANLVQTITIKIPDGTFPVPNIVPTGTIRSTPTTSKQDWWAFCGASGRLANIVNRTWLTDPIDAGPGNFFRDGYDTVRSMVPSHGDFRLVAANHAVPDTVFVKHPLYDDVTARMAHNLAAGAASGSSQSAGRAPKYDVTGKYISTLTYPDALAPDIPSNATQTPEATGDYDTGLALCADGPFLNKPDEGNIKDLTAGGTPYYTTTYQYDAAGMTYFSPNRIMPSPGMFGSLPTKVQAGSPWRTLLFRPQTSHPADKSHNSALASLQDHLLLDLFWMPVVEPYAASDRFSTAGKINMNYQIMPFTYIRRASGLAALLKSEMVATIPNKEINTYKPPLITGTYATDIAANSNYRVPVNTDETLTQFDDRFKAGQVFVSASEICDVHIVPQGATLSGMASYWSANPTTGHALTGDNLRERIYTTLYPRLTTKSNTYTVHFRVQALKQTSKSTADVWTEGKDVVLSEYRGSTGIERFIDAENPLVPDYGASTDPTNMADTLDKFYRWRVVSNRVFAP